MHLLTIHLGEHGEILTEDVVQALELLSEPETLECCQISAHAVSGLDNAETICIRALVGNQVMLALMDSGSSTALWIKTLPSVLHWTWLLFHQ